MIRAGIVIVKQTGVKTIKEGHQERTSLKMKKRNYQSLHLCKVQH